MEGYGEPYNTSLYHTFSSTSKQKSDIFKGSLTSSVVKKKGGRSLDFTASSDLNSSI